MQNQKKVKVLRGVSGMKWQDTPAAVVSLQGAHPCELYVRKKFNASD